MAAPPLANSLEGGSDGTNVTPANSGGTSGDALDITGDATDVAVAYDTSAARGSVSMEFTTAAAPGSGSYRGWGSLGSITANLYMRVDLYIPALAETVWIFRYYDATPARCAGLFISTSGGLRTVRVENAAGTTVGTNGTVSVPTDAWFRLEARILPSTTVGELEWRWWTNPDSALAVTPDDSANNSGLVLGANVNQARFGPQAWNTTPSTNTSRVFRYDNLALATSGFIGPAILGQTIRPDADISAGGWTTSPLFSKINDGSDATFITGTAS